MFDPTQFSRKADIRGVYPNELNEELAFFTGRYLVKYVAGQTGEKATRILVGRDGRTSSPAIYRALCEGIAVEGGEPLPCGLSTTDMIQWGAGLQLQSAVAGAMVTASHNPPEYNGIKMLLRNPQTQGLDIIRPVDHLRPFFEKDGDSAAAPKSRLLPYPSEGGFSLHRDFVAAASERAKHLAKASGKVVLDPGNGVGCILIPLLKDVLKSKGAGVELLSIFNAIDGSFPNRPSNPGLPGAVSELQATVKQSGAAFGAALDGDADRVFLVDEQGEFVPGSQLLAALAASALKKSGGDGAVVFAAVSSFAVIDAIRAEGGTPIFCRVGQDAAKVALIKTKAVFGGESSAHYNFPDVYCLDSGLFALMMFWDLLLESGEPCSKALAPYAPWANSGEVNLRIECGDWKAMSRDVIDMLVTRYSSDAENCYVTQLDGVGVYHPKVKEIPTADDLFQVDEKGDPSGKIYRVVAKDYRPEWWFNVRASNNEPLLRINLECQDASKLDASAKSLIDAVHGFCVKNGARVHVESPGNLAIALT
jgi:phosphomannomutase